MLYFTYPEKLNLVIIKLNSTDDGQGVYLRRRSTERMSSYSRLISLRMLSLSVTASSRLLI